MNRNTPSLLNMEDNMLTAEEQVVINECECGVLVRRWKCRQMYVEMVFHLLPAR